MEKKRKGRITKVYKSETAHIVRNASSKRCRYNVHGHSYKWAITIEGPIDKESGMVIDFKDLEPLKNIIDKFDHSMVMWKKESSDFVQFFKDNTKRHIVMQQNPTAENMARVVHKSATDWLIRETFKQSVNEKTMGKSNYRIAKVQVWETETGSAIAYDHDAYDTIAYIRAD